MKQTIVVLLAAILALGFSSPVRADEDPILSITINLEIMTISMPDIKSSDLHAPETARMLIRAAQLARYTACELVKLNDSQPCSRFLE